MTSLCWFSTPLTLLALGGCQIISGLSNLEEGAGGNGTTTSSTTGTTTSSTTGTTTSSTTGTTTSGTTTTGANCYICSAADVCVDKPCETMSFATMAPTAIASDGTYVYWGTKGAASGPSGTIRRFAIDSPATPPPADVVTDVDPSPIAVAGHTLYWIDLGSNGVMSADASAASLPTAATKLFPIDNATYMFDGAEQLRLVGSAIYWTVGGRLVHRGTTAATVAPLTFDLMNRNPFGVDLDNVFFGDGNNVARVDFTTASPISQSILAGAKATLVTADTTLGGDVYFVQPGAPNSSQVGKMVIVHATKGGTVIDTLAEEPFAGAILADNDYVYWTRSGTAPPACENVELFAKLVAGGAGSPARRLATGLPSCDTQIIQDDNYIFWLGTDSIDWVRKPPK